MAPNNDAEMSATDFYDLLAIPATSNESEIRRAYRKQSRLYHPDKVTPTPETLEKFQLLQHAIELLTDATKREKYDAAREAKLRRAAETAALDGRRRRMVEDLEQREADARLSAAAAGGSNGGVKRTWSDRELEIKRIQEANRKRVEEMRARKMEELKKAAEPPRSDERDNGEVDNRAVKMTWIKEGDGLEIDDEALRDMFPAGQVENVVLLKDKKRRVEGRNKKVVLGTALLVFSTVSVAKDVVAKGKTDEFESVAWAVGEGSETKPA